jgi:cyclic nucleotide gated channel
VEEMRVKMRDAEATERWMSQRMLPDNLKRRIRSYEQYKWKENRGFEEETLIRKLPKDLRRDIKRHLCLDLVRRVSIVHNHFSPCKHFLKKCICVMNISYS